MYTEILNKRSVGVSFLADSQADVVVWAPHAQQVAIKIHEPPITLLLNQESLGCWRIKTDKIRPGGQYTFILDDKKESPDPASLCQPHGIDGPSQAVDTAQFHWEDQGWVNPALESYIIYEIHTGTFTPEGTFAAIEEKLDHLKALGVNAIEIMPVAQFPDARNWGYDGIFTYAVQNSYGGASALQHLINACHYKGIAVILDVVYNHFGQESDFLNDFGPYLTNKYCTPWGDAVNFDNAWCDGVRQYVIENALMWLRDFHVDALRLDAVHAIKDCSPVHILQELRQTVDRLMKSTGRQHYLLVECDLNDPKFIDPIAQGGYGMDAQWVDEFHHAMRVTIGEEKKGYYADFEGLPHLTKSYRDGYVYDGQFSVVRQRLFGRKAEGNPGHQFIVFSQNHDQVGNRQFGERSSQLYSYDTIKLMAGAVLVSPYIPLLFMGEEWGETAPFFYFSTHTDPELAKAVRQGRQEEFAGFRSDGHVPDPQSRETFQQAKLQWELLNQESHQTLLRYYQTLLALRQQLPALHNLNRQQLEIKMNDNQQTLLLHRWHENQHVLCFMNFSDQLQSIEVTTSGADTPWHKLLDSSDEQWLPQADAGIAPESWSGMALIPVQSASIVIYAQNYEKSHLNLPYSVS